MSAVHGINSRTSLEVGHRKRTEILKLGRAEYGERMVPMLATKLALEFGQGFAERILRP